MEECLAVGLIEDFTRDWLRPYNKILVKCQELVILTRNSADDILLREEGFRQGSKLYQLGKTLGAALVSISPAAGPSAGALVTAGRVISNAAELSQLVHSVVRDIKDWKTHKEVKAAIEEKKIEERLTAIFDKIDRLSGKKVQRYGTWSKDSIKEKIRRKHHKVALDVGSNLHKNVSVIKDMVRDGKALTALKKSRGSMPVTAQIGATGGSKRVTNVVRHIDVGMSVAVKALDIVKRGTEYMGISGSGGSEELMTTCEVLLSSLNTITIKVTEASSVLHAIINAHISSKDSGCSFPHDTDHRISNFAETIEELKKLIDDGSFEMDLQSQ